MFSIKKVLKDSYNFYLSKIVTLVGITSIVYIIGLLFEYISSGLYDYSVVFGIVVGIILSVILFIIEIGYIKFILKFVGGGDADVSDLLLHTKFFWKYLFAMILYGLAVFIGLILLVVPGIYIALRFAFAPLILIDKDLGIKESFKKSTEITKDVKWKLLGFFVIIGMFQLILGASLSIDPTMTIYHVVAITFVPFMAVLVVKTYRSLLGLDS
ncbi:MAG: hypothetical protein MRY49_00280 [Candidatus Pacebacteria bacterium]|nr:hypothetical protein [Candidatus Paceibacterota bacterium]